MQAIGLGLGVLGMVAAGSAHAGQYAFQQLDYKGRASTVASGISGNGIVVGYYANSENGTHGFVWKDGFYTSVDAPSVRLTAVNNSGLAVGQTAGRYGFPFEYDLATGKGMELPVGVHTNGKLTSVNDAGTAVGDIRRNGHFQGLLVDPSGVVTLLRPAGYKDAQLTMIDPGGKAVGDAEPFKGRPFTLLTLSDKLRRVAAPAGAGAPVQILPSGDIIGNVANGEGYRLSGGTVTTIAYPGAASTYVVGVDKAGRTYGSYAPTGELPTASFVYDGTTYFPLSAPGATATVVTAVNASGQIVGYDTVGGVTRGFLATCLVSQQPCTQ